ncbi:polyisoprenoid diphosphate/phosphate phosphohydrolase PLPP6 [Daktulosphaira vitifoliae]|uniref:polyisoprenoid diphosphate/phosphate phosphohydrolase PLPP6 n=1 Tax=Daktulosphaira vitifoliae TaxID=58002 RepID=UPI0021A9B885|nr:polyisoprenoid diphosphate/phosphate phosphohydrolase PLPP6 [Daktulosphaira vitifoliae]
MSTKRNIPSILSHLLNLDSNLTSIFCNSFCKLLPPRKFNTYYKGLEYSCHGILWLSSWLAFIWLIWTPSMFQMQVNFLFGLLIDIVVVAILKAFIRRRRPVGNKNDQWITIGPDVYSFPSGHVSRAFFIAFYFHQLYPLNKLINVLCFVWAIAVALSRILLRRHHLLDVFAGSIIGYLISFVVNLFWLDQSSAEYIISFLSDDKAEGGEYHV